MWSKLEEVFKQIGLPYSRQGSYSDESEYPSSFFTFWNFDVPEEGFFDNEANRAVWFWEVYYYTNDPSTIYSQMDVFVKLAKQTGFICEGRGNDIPSDRPDYLGRTITIKYIENYAKQED